MTPKPGATPAPGGLRITPLGPERLLQRIEAALRAGDVSAARATAHMGRAHFPHHQGLSLLAVQVERDTPAACLAAQGWSRPWHLAEIPRRIHFYWGSERTSYLRYLSIASFRLLNPDWEVFVHLPKSIHSGASDWGTGEAYEGNSYRGRDYAPQLFSLPGLQLREVDFSAFPALAGAMETYKADFFRWHILQEEGGLYSDTDILFTKPVREAPFNLPAHAKVRLGLCLHQNLHSIGFLFSAPGSPVFRRILEAAPAALDPSNYQSIGSYLLHHHYPSMDRIARLHPETQALNLPMELVYPLDFTRMDEIHGPGDPARLPKGTIGLHWYAGALATQIQNNLITHETCGLQGTLLDRLAKGVASQLPPVPEVRPLDLPNPEQAPTFSVLVPTYNQADFLKEALDSLLRQTRGDWEAVVVDDGSTDHTRKVLEAYQARDARIRAFHQPNGGVGAALTRALKEARGTWIGWLSSDDRYEPGALEVFAKGIATFPEARFFHSNFSQLFEATGELRPMPAGRQLTLPPFELQTLALLESNYVNGISICIQKALLEDVGPWKPELRYAQDHDLWLRLSARTRLYYLDQRTCISRIHGGQGSQTFPMACYYDSAVGCHTFLNAHRFEDLFPCMNLMSNMCATQAMDATLRLMSTLDAFIYRGVGLNTALLDRFAEWLMGACPADYRAQILKGLPVWCHGYVSYPPVLRERLETLGDPARARFQPHDPLDLMEAHLRELEAAGDAVESAELRRYLERVAGRTLDPPATLVREAFLHAPDWMDSRWVAVLVGFLRTFQPQEPVALAMVWDASESGQLSAQEAQDMVMELAAREGRTAIPTLILVDRPADLETDLAAYGRRQWIPAPGSGTDLEGLAGQRLQAGLDALRRGRVAART